MALSGHPTGGRFSFSRRVRGCLTAPLDAVDTGGCEMKETGWNPTSMPTRETQLAYMRPEPGRSQREAAAFAVQTSEVLREPEISGTRGDRVTVCVETVKPDKKDDFDRLLREVIAPAARRGSGRSSGGSIRRRRTKTARGPMSPYSTRSCRTPRRAGSACWNSTTGRRPPPSTSAPTASACSAMPSSSRRHRRRSAAQVVVVRSTPA